MICFEPYLICIAYWLSVGHAEYDVVSQKATEQKKYIYYKKNRKRKTVKLSE